MSNNFNNAIDFLYNLEKFGISFGLHKISALLQPFDNPQNKLKVIHIAGSNGNGSTAAIIESIIMNHGFSTGLYTSPHLVKFNERIRINGKNISDDDIVSYVNKLKPYYDKINMHDPVTFFDFTTAIAYLFFFDKKVDFAIMETGLGGKLDSTNIIEKSLVSVITNITKEHEEYLGNDIVSIAEEKAGIIKKNGTVTTGESHKDVLSLFKKICNAKNAELHVLNDNVKINTYGKGFFNYISDIYKFYNLKCNLSGEHQVYNSALAIFSLEKSGFILKENIVANALKNVKWEGRLEQVMDNPLFLIDGAHNPAGAEVLRKSLREFKYNRLIFIMSVMKDKDIERFLHILTDIADTVIFTKAKIDRAADINYLKEIGTKINKNILIEKNIPTAIKKSVEISNEDDMICFTGSLYAVGEAKEFFGSEKGAFSVGNNYKN